MISLIDLINKYLDNNYFAFGVFIDLQKAFDTVYREILPAKLDFYGIRGLANSWLKSFIENRKQCAILPGHSSSVKTVTCGVPQGSTLDPLLFLLYINVLFQNPPLIILQITLTFYFLPKSLVQLNPSLTMN